MKSVLISILILALLYVLASALFILGLAWTHYPYGLRKRKKK